MQALVDPGSVDDVEARDGESESCGFDAATDDDLCFVCEASVGLVFWWEPASQDFLEYRLLGIV